MRVNLQGEIISDEWAQAYKRWGYEAGYCNPAMVRSAVAQLAEGEELVLEINSVGGDVDAAREMYSIVKTLTEAGRQTVAEVQSLAASAASWLILACDEVKMSLASELMIHQTWMYTVGNANGLRHDAGVLDASDETMLNLYCAKCGDKCSRERLRELIEQETYITAPDAVKMGLADSIIGGHDPEAFPALVNSAHNAVVRAMRTLPPIEELMQRERENRDWKTQAALEIEAAMYVV